MPFKGTDRKAWDVARQKGGTKKQMSRNYQKEKQKNEKMNSSNSPKTERRKNTNVEPSFFSSKNSTNYTDRNYDSSDRPRKTFKNPTNYSIGVENKPIKNAEKTSIEPSKIKTIKLPKPNFKNISFNNNNFKNKIVSKGKDLALERLQEIILDFCKTKISKETKNVLENVETFYDIIKIGNKLYKVLREYIKEFDEIKIDIKEVKANKENMKIYKRDYYYNKSFYKTIEKTSKDLINLSDLELWTFDHKDDELFNLVANGIKIATSSLLFPNFKNKNKYSILENFDKSKRLLLKTTKLKKVKFKDVTEKMATLEGEGDLTLDYWRKGHIEFFTKELKKVEKPFSEEIYILFEEFNVVKELR